MFSPIIEYLLAQSRPGGGFLCFASRWQFLIPVLPPGLTLNFTIGPPTGYYAAIKYALSISQDTVPRTVYNTVTQGGVTYTVGMITPDWSREYLNYFIVFTEAEPILLELTNISNVNQRCDATQWNVLIPTQEDFLLVKEHIAAQSSLVTNSLLKELTKKRC